MSSDTSVKYPAVFDRLGRYIISKGADLERSLQVASGAVYLALLGGMLASWSGILEPGGRLRLALVLPLGVAGWAFCVTLFAAGFRVVLIIGAGELPTRLASWSLKAAIVLWVVSISLSVILLIEQGFLFVEGAMHTTERELSSLEASTTKEVEGLESEMQKLEGLEAEVQKLRREVQKLLDAIENQQ